MNAESVPCPICREPINPKAKKCIHCNEYLVRGWTGVKGKTLWNWLRLLLVPLSLVAMGFLLIDYQGQLQDKLDATTEASRANILQTYLDDMQTIILSQDLRDTKVKNVVQVLTLTMLHELDADRRNIALRFLKASGMMDWVLKGATLIGADLQRVYLEGADLYLSDLRWADLYDAKLKDASLGGASLQEANLWRANLARADLHGASMFRAKLMEADLSRANLYGAILLEANLAGANLRGANFERALYSEGTTWPEGFDPVAAGAVLFPLPPPGK